MFSLKVCVYIYMCVCACVPSSSHLICRHQSRGSVESLDFNLPMHCIQGDNVPVFDVIPQIKCRRLSGPEMLSLGAD